MSAKASLANMLVTPEPPELGPGPRPGVRTETELNGELDQKVRDLPLTDRQQLVRALVLLWHDHLDPAHRLAQDIPGADGAFVHGIMHRREPDYGNAAYWFRRVGQHPSFTKLSQKVSVLLCSDTQQSLRNALVPNGKWDPFAFISACERAESASKDNSEQELLRQIQRLETETLLEFLSG